MQDLTRSAQPGILEFSEKLSRIAQAKFAIVGLPIRGGNDAAMLCQ
jgi:hypothetical protein